MFAFLSDEWVEAARAIRDRHVGQITAVPPPLRMNVVITGVEFGDGTVRSYVDTSDGLVMLELGELASPEVTITTDYATARSLFVGQDMTAVMAAFMAGKVRVQGDLSKLLALQSTSQGEPPDPVGQRVADEIRAITAT